MYNRKRSANEVRGHAAFVNSVLDMFNECSSAISNLDYWQYADKKADAAYHGFRDDCLIDMTINQLRDHLGSGATQELSDICDSCRALYEDEHMAVLPVVSEFLDSIDSVHSAYEDHDSDVDLSDYVRALQNLDSMGTSCDICQELRDLADEIADYADAIEENEETLNRAVATFGGAFDDLAEWLMSELGYCRQPNIMAAFADNILESDYGADFADGI